jgi:hypothetical protein
VTIITLFSIINSIIIIDATSFLIHKTASLAQIFSIKPQQIHANTNIQHLWLKKPSKSLHMQPNAKIRRNKAGGTLHSSHRLNSATSHFPKNGINKTCLMSIPFVDLH